MIQPKMRDMELQLADIQGIVISGYGHLRFSSYHFLRFTDVAKAREWLAAIVQKVTTSDWGKDGKPSKPKTTLNIAFTNQGLQFLGLPQDSLKTFPQEFCEGMCEQHRSRRLGDNGASDPTHWAFGGPTNEIHALLILEAGTAIELSAHCGFQSANYKEKAVAEAASTVTGEMPEDSREHFGFRDSISQPTIAGAPGHAASDTDAIRPGEFILGYLNEYGVLPPALTVPATIDPTKCLPAYEADEKSSDVGRNGSFLVLRKIYQDVAAFNRFIASLSDDSHEQAWFSAKLVGRWQSGAPLVLSPNTDDDPELYKRNKFGYMASDPSGFACPLGAHIRRTNPRDSLEPDPDQSIRTVRRHRLLRRGVPFGPRWTQSDETTGEKADRGLLFICINADIQRQFEFVQQTWINDTKFNGLYSERDPLVGDNPESGEVADPNDGMMTIQGEPVRRRLRGLQRFVRLQGGGYFFLPSIAALRFLSTLK
jgi:Dyp-type peroxidase family